MPTDGGNSTINGDLMVNNGDFNGMIWKITIKIVDFPMNSMVDLSIAMLNYQRVQGN